MYLLFQLITKTKTLLCVSQLKPAHVDPSDPSLQTVKTSHQTDLPD